MNIKKIFQKGNALRLFSLLFIIGNIVLWSWSVLHNDIYYYTDIGRDFLIFDEIVTKKIVLLGPRADAKGLFHGILWHYIITPAYIIGRGNPIFVGFFWIGLTITFLIACYFIVKKLFDRESALIAAVLMSTYLVPYTQGYFHGNGAMLALPLFFFFFVRYMQTAKAKFLLAHLFLLGVVTQFEIALGLPLCILSGIAVLFLIIKNKKILHIFCFAILAIPFSTFILFDVKHNFLQFRSYIAYSHGARDGLPVPFISSLTDRVVEIMTNGINLFKFSLSDYNKIIFVFFFYNLYQAFRKRKNKYTPVYIAFLYFFIGFWALTLLHGGYMIMFWWLPFTVLPLLIFSTFHRYSPKFIFYILFFIILGVSTYQNISYIKEINSGYGISHTSWQFYFNHAKVLFQDAPNDFGYFLYAPDIYGYQQKYALLYEQRLTHKNAAIFVKKPVTYVLVEPPPSFRTDMEPDWWIKDQLGITKKPMQITHLEGDYLLYRYELTDEEIQMRSNVDMKDWLFYR